MKDILISSAVLIPAIVLLRFCFRKTISRRAQYALWLPVLLRLLLLFSLGGSAWSVSTAVRNVSDGTEAAEMAAEVSRLQLPRMSFERAYGEVTAEAEAAGEDLAAMADSELDSRAYARMRGSLTVLGALRLLWLGGVGVMALLLLGQNLRFARRLRRTRVPLEGAESRYPVYLCDNIPSPCLFGFFRPGIYVTSAAARDRRTLGYVLAHEETHGMHLDLLWAFLRSLCLALWWFHPLVWLAASLSRIDCELACDEGVLARLQEEERIPYGEALLALVPRGRPGNHMLSATTMTSGKRQMKDRIDRIARARRPLLIALAAVLLLAGAACAVTFPGAKQPGEGDKPEAVRVFSLLLPENELFYSEDGGVWHLMGKLRQSTEGAPQQVRALRCGPVFLPETEDVGQTLKLQITGIHEATREQAKLSGWWYLDYAYEQGDLKPKAVTLSLQIRLDGQWYLLPVGGIIPNYDPARPDSISLVRGRLYPEDTEQIIPGHYRLVLLRDWRGSVSLDVAEFDLAETAEGFALENVRKPAELFGEEAYIPDREIRREDGSAWHMAEASSAEFWDWNRIPDILEAR